MSEVTKQQVEEALRGYKDPYLDKDLLVTQAIKGIEIEGDQVSITVTLGYPAEGIRDEIGQGVAQAVGALEGVKQVAVAIDWNIAANSHSPEEPTLEHVKNIIAIASGKGGVGKSTTAVNLALALSAEGARVGLLDADVYGPSQQIMLGIHASERPRQLSKDVMYPLEAHGIKTMSIGALVAQSTPMVWRGPMAASAMVQMLSQTFWEDIDYLIIDMPPGTGDIQLTLAQKVSVAGAVIVTTPQDIALLDAKRGIEMFEKVDVPVLGVIENMAVHVCTKCGNVDHLFGEGGGQRIAEQYHVPLLGSLPLSRQIREEADSGSPTVAANPDSEVSKLYRDAARAMAAQLAARASGAVQVVPNIVVSND